MSDPKSSYGEPVDEPRDVDADVVGRAHEGLADAEAAGRPVDEQSSADATFVEPAAAPAEPLGAEPVPSERVVDEPVAAEPVAAEPAATPAETAAATTATPVAEPESATTPWYERQDEDEARWAAYAASADTPADDAPTVVAEPVAPAAAAAAAAPAYAENPAVFPAGQPIFVQAPEAPQPRGNRGAAGAIGLLAAVAFAVLYAAATLGLGLLYQAIGFEGLVDASLATLTTWALWVPVVVFYFAFWFLGAIINRGAWGHWVVWGLIVGVAAWAGHILGQLFEAPFWTLTAREGATLVSEQILSPLAIVAFVLGRELTIWFGAWVARRGKRITEINNEAQREYERTLEAGPQVQR